MKQNQKDKLGNAFSKFFEDNGVKIIDCEISNKKEQPKIVGQECNAEFLFPTQGNKR